MLTASGSQQLRGSNPLPKTRTENRAGKMNISKGTSAKCVSPPSTSIQHTSEYPNIRVNGIPSPARARVTSPSGARDGKKHGCLTRPYSHSHDLEFFC